MPNLTTSGLVFNGSSVTVAGTPDRIEAPSNLISVHQAWVAARVAPTFASSGTPTGNPRVFSWRPSGAQYIELFWDTAGHQLVAGRSAGSASVPLSPTFAANEHITVIAAWDGTNLKVSFNGGSFSSVASAGDPTISDSTFDICRLGNQAASDWWQGDIFWFTAGTGTLSDADAATINGFGDTDPAWSSIPGSRTMVWYAVNTSYLDTAPSTDVILPTWPRIRFNG